MKKVLGNIQRDRPDPGSRTAAGFDWRRASSCLLLAALVLTASACAAPIGLSREEVDRIKRMCASNFGENPQYTGDVNRELFKNEECVRLGIKKALKDKGNPPVQIIPATEDVAPDAIEPPAEPAAPAAADPNLSAPP